MSCGCEPCKPQPYRCSCERDCWIGAPEDYADCMDACKDSACEFPLYPGLPSRGYRCADPVDGEETCRSGCDTARISALDDCTSQLTACQDGASTPEEGFACLEAECACRSSAEQDYKSCGYECDATIVWPAAFDCAGDIVSEDSECCAVDLSDCYTPCETAFLAAAETVEDAYITCVKGKAASYPGYYVWDGEFNVCNGGNQPDIIPCEKAWSNAMAPIFKAHRLCRASCERAEIARETPADRKYTECGGPYHYCKEKCAAEFDEDLAGVADIAYTCLSSCLSLTDPDDYEACRKACVASYRAAYASAVNDQLACNLNCCKRENPGVPHHHELAECQVDCRKDRILSEVACYAAYVECLGDNPDDPTTQASCNADWCACDAEWMETYNQCIKNCWSNKQGDCPDCYRDALNEGSGGGGSDNFGYHGALNGLPQAGVGLRPTCS